MKLDIVLVSGITSVKDSICVVTAVVFRKFTFLADIFSSNVWICLEHECLFCHNVHIFLPSATAFFIHLDLKLHWFVFSGR